MKIGIIDADILDNGSRHPNLALLKISAYYKSKGNHVELLHDYLDIKSYDKVFISKVFDFTNIPIDINDYDNLEIGGTGFFGINAPNLPDEIEHHMPDYTLYDKYIESEIERGLKANTFDDFKNASIGFLTRGCFRKCPFCVNRKYDRPVKHSEIEEFMDSNRKYLYFWDDNFLAYPKWKEELEKIKLTGKRFQFRQGLDIRLMTEEKAEILSKMKYHGDYIFAFDHIKDRDIIEKNIKIWKKHCNKTTKLYVLCAYESQDVNDIINTFERIKILMENKCLPYIMRYSEYKNSELKGMYITLSRWCNQPNLFKKKSFREYCELSQSQYKDQSKTYASMRYLKDFEDKYPEIAKKYFDMKYED